MFDLVRNRGRGRPSLRRRIEAPLIHLACILAISAAACFFPHYESYFEPSAEGARLGSTYCDDNRHGPPALAEFLIQSVPIGVYAYHKPEEPGTIVIRIEVGLSDGQTLSFDPSEVKAVNLAVNRSLTARPDRWSRHFLGAAESHAVDGPLNTVGHPRFNGGLDRIVLFWNIAADGTNHFSVEFPPLMIGGSAHEIPAIVFTEKSGVFALPVFGNC